jgi:EpsI family protein
MQPSTSLPQSGNSPVLAERLVDFGNWRQSRVFSMSDKIVKALRLDDYFYRGFSRAGKHVSLYIGYYHSSKKVGAAHDPTVCFPGQGWVLKDIKKGSLPVEVSGKQVELDYSTMVAERNGHRELLVYWFQAGRRATPDTLSQKLALMQSKFLGEGESNAFVRIDTSLDNKSYDEAFKLLQEFIGEFYPRFIDFIDLDSRKSKAGEEK